MSDSNTIYKVFNDKLQKGYEEASRFYLSNYKNLIERGDVELAKSMLEELSITPLSFELNLAKAEILSICLKRNESLALCKELEKSDDGKKSFDLKLLVSRLLTKLGFFKESRKKLNEIIKAVNSGGDNFSSSYNSTELMVITLSELSKIYILKEQYQKSLVLLREAEKLISEKGISPKNRATIYFYMASVFFSKGDFSEALTYREKANAIFIDEGMQENIAISNFNIAMIHFHLTNFEKTFLFLEKSERICKDHGYEFILAGVYHLRGVYYVRRGEFNRALDSFLLTDKIIGHLENNIQNKRNKLWISNVYRINGDLDRAERYLPVNLSDDNTVLALESLSCAALLSLDRRQIEEASKYFRQTELSLHDNKNRINLIIANLALSEFNIYLGKYHNALNYAKRALRIGKKSNIILYGADSMQMMAKALLNIRKLNDGRRTINEAIRYHRKFESNYELVSDLLILSEIEHLERNYSSSLRLLFDAIKIADQYAYYERIALLKIKIACNYIAQSKYALAFLYAVKSLKLSTRKSYIKYLAASYLIFKKLILSSFLINFKEISIEMEINEKGDIDILFDKYYSRLDNGDKLWIKNLGIDDIRENIFKYTIHTKEGITTLDENGYLEFNEDANKKYHLVVDTVSANVHEREAGKIDFSSRSMLTPLLEFLILNKGKVFSKEDLITLVWHGKYNPLSHDNVIYTSINRLRNLIEPKKDKFKYIKNIGNGYFFDPIQDYCLIKRHITLDEELNFRQKWVLEYLMTEPMITNKEYSAKFNINRTTTFLELNTLVLKNFLERSGKGRSTYYSSKQNI